MPCLAKPESRMGIGATTPRSTGKGDRLFAVGKRRFLLTCNRIEDHATS